MGIEVMVESQYEFCGDEQQSRRVEGFIEQLKASLQSNDLVYDVKETFLMTWLCFG